MAIMLSIKPQYVADILNNCKTLEVRKSCPKEWNNYLSGKTKVKPQPQKCFIYCTKQGRPLVFGDVQIGAGQFIEIYTQTYNWSKKDADKIWGNLQGKVVGYFTLDEIEKIRCCYVPYKHYDNLGYENFIDDGVYQVDGKDGLVFERNDNRIDTMLKNKDFAKMCLEPIDIYKYLGDYGAFYMWHISNLHIYDEPKELSEFKTLPCKKSENACGKCKYLEVINTPNAYETNCYVMNGKQIIRPPQSYCYCEEVNNDN